MIKDSKYIKTNILNSLYLLINKLNGCFEEINRNKYLMLVPSNESKEKNSYRSITKNSDHYDEKYVKIKMNSDDELQVKIMEISSMMLVVRAVLHENNK